MICVSSTFRTILAVASRKGERVFEPVLFFIYLKGREIYTDTPTHLVRDLIAICWCTLQMSMTARDGPAQSQESGGSNWLSHAMVQLPILPSWMRLSRKLNWKFRYGTCTLSHPGNSTLGRSSLSVLGVAQHLTILGGI